MKKWMMIGTTALLAGALAACGGEAENNTAKEQEASEELLNPKLAEELDADVEYVFGNDELDRSFELKGATFEVSAYDIVKVSDIKDESATTFIGGEKEGYILSVKHAVENNHDEGVWIRNLLYVNAQKEGIISTGILPSAGIKSARQNKLRSDAGAYRDFYAPDLRAEGIETFALTNEEFAEMEQTLGVMQLTAKESHKEIEVTLEDDPAVLSGDYFIDLPVNEEQAAESEARASVYRDHLLVYGWAEKDVYAEQELNETKQIGDVSVTLEGIQYADLAISEEVKRLFGEWAEKDIVAATAKVTYENGSDEPIDINQTISSIESEAIRTANQAFGEPLVPIIQPGETVEKLHLYLFEKSDLENTATQLHLGPFVNPDLDIVTGEETVIELPQQ